MRSLVSQGSAKNGGQYQLAVLLLLCNELVDVRVRWLITLITSRDETWPFSAANLSKRYTHKSNYSVLCAGDGAGDICRMSNSKPAGFVSYRMGWGVQIQVGFIKNTFVSKNIRL